MTEWLQWSLQVLKTKFTFKELQLSPVYCVRRRQPSDVATVLSPDTKRNSRESVERFEKMTDRYLIA